MLEIIVRVVSGLIPFVWIISLIFWNKKELFGALLTFSTIVLSTIGCIDCLLTAFGL